MTTGEELFVGSFDDLLFSALLLPLLFGGGVRLELFVLLLLFGMLLATIADSSTGCCCCCGVFETLLFDGGRDEESIFTSFY